MYELYVNMYGVSYIYITTITYLSRRMRNIPHTILAITISTMRIVT
jgi:hypothetical protein